MPIMFFVVLTYMVLSTATYIMAECPDCIRGPGETCYNVSYLHTLDANFRDHVVIKKMAVLQTNNTLFYSYEPVIKDPEYYKVAFINLDNPADNGTLSGQSVHNFGTFDIDQEKKILYLGGRDGIFTYDESRKLVGYSSFGDEILSLFYKNHLYIVKANDSKIIVKKGDNFMNINEDAPVKNFVISGNNVIVYIGAYGLFLSRGGEKVKLSKNNFFRGLAVDTNGTVYAWWIDEIYRIDIKDNLSDSRLEKFGDNIRNLVSLTFDKDNNLLFTVGKALFKMTPVDFIECWNE